MFDFVDLKTPLWYKSLCTKENICNVNVHAHNEIVTTDVLSILSYQQFCILNIFTFDNSYMV